MRKISFSLIILLTFNSLMGIAATSKVQTKTEEATLVEQTVSSEQAAPTNTIQTTTMPGLMLNNVQKLFGTLSVGYSSNLYESSSYDSKVETSAEGVLNYRVKDQHLLRTYVAASKDMNKGQESHLKDSWLAWVNNNFWHSGKITTIGQQVRIAIPLSKESLQRDEKLTGVTVAPLAMFNLTPVGLTGVMLIYQPAFTKNFHKYVVNNAFKTNNEYTISQLFRAVWSFTERSYVLSDFIYKNAWSYGGVKKDDSTTYEFSFGHMVTQAFSVSLGVSTDATVRNQEYGSDQSVSVFNRNKSSIFTGLSYVF